MTTMLALFNLGGGEIILILALILILFGARKLPELAKGLGQGIKEFKKATREVTDEIQSSMDDNSYSTPPSRRLDQPQDKLPESSESAEASSVSPPAEPKS
jgi:sec-independent protein translocase protein TatA